MSKFFVRRRPFQRRWFYPVLSLTILLVWLGLPLVARAIPWVDLFRQGVQAVQLSKLSDSQEVAIGQQINDQLVGQQFKLYRDGAVNAYVNQLGQRLAAHSGRPNLPYKYQIVEDNSINAFATMGGFVYVHTGLLKVADNEAQLASVLGHETGHINARHLVKQMRRAAVEQGLLDAAGLNQSQVVNLGTDLAINRPRSRQNEYEADQRGLKILGNTGYAQSAMVAFMQKLLNASSPPVFLSDHPGTPERIVALRKNIDPAHSSGAGLDSAFYKAKLRPLLTSG